MLQVDSERAVEIILKHMDAIPHDAVGVVRLVQFSHSAPQITKLKRQIAEGLVALLEKELRLVPKSVSVPE